jgi:hypothetical protein
MGYNGEHHLLAGMCFAKVRQVLFNRQLIWPQANSNCGNKKKSTSYLESNLSRLAHVRLSEALAHLRLSEVLAHLRLSEVLAHLQPV